MGHSWVTRGRTGDWRHARARNLDTLRCRALSCWNSRLAVDAESDDLAVSMRRSIAKPTGSMMAGPQALALIALCCPAGDLAGTVDGTGRGVRVRLEVEPSGRLGIAPAVHGHGDEVRPVFEVAG